MRIPVIVAILDLLIVGSLTTDISAEIGAISSQLLHNTNAKLRLGRRHFSTDGSTLELANKVFLDYFDAVNTLELNVVAGNCTISDVKEPTSMWDVLIEYTKRYG